MHSSIVRLVASALLWSSLAFGSDIHDAALKGDLQKVKALLSGNPALVSGKNDDGETPLHVAVECGHRDTAELLLDYRADINAKTKLGRTPLYYADFYSRCSKDPMPFFTGRSGEILPIGSAWSLFDNYKDLMLFLLDRGADVNARDFHGGTPLHWFSARPQVNTDVVKLLLANKADVNAKNVDEETPLHFAAKFDHRDVVKVLLENKADVNAKDKDGRTPLYHAMQNSRRIENVPELLRQHGGHE